MGRCKFRLIASIILISGILALYSCSSSKSALKPSWNFEKNGIQLHIVSSNKLNLYNNSPHTTILVIYELSDIGKFKQFASYADGIKQLINGTVNDPSFIYFEKLFIEPGKTYNVRLDRLNKVKWLGLIAGYYSLNPQKVIKYYKIPYVVKGGFLFFKKSKVVIPTVRLNVYLKKDILQIEEIKSEE